MNDADGNGKRMVLFCDEMVQRDLAFPSRIDSSFSSFKNFWIRWLLKFFGFAA
jgi:hypothetical protein